MNRLLFASAAAAFLSAGLLMPKPAEAFPAAPMSVAAAARIAQASRGAATVIKVAGDCGTGWHRGPRGACHH